MGELDRHDPKCGKHRGFNGSEEGPAQPGGSGRLALAHVKGDQEAAR